MRPWIRTRIVPLCVWLGTITAAIWLWRDVHDEDSAIGFAAGFDLTVAPAEPGRIAALAVAPGQRVRAGDVLAVLAADVVAAERSILTAERERVEAQLGAVEVDTAVRLGDAARELDESVAAADLALRSARSERRVRAAELAALDAQRAALAGLVDARMADRRQLDALAVKRAALAQEVDAAGALVHELVRQAGAARSRRAALPHDATELTLRPLRAELAALAGRERLLDLRSDAAVLRAPADGEIAAIHRRPGEFAPAGEPVLTLVAPGPGDAVVVCVREAMAARVQIGGPVSLRARSLVGPAFTGHVSGMSPRIAELPPRCRRDPSIPEWGREVTVTLDRPAPLLPGQSFSVAFHDARPRTADAPVDAALARRSEEAP